MENPTEGLKAWQAALWAKEGKHHKTVMVVGGVAVAVGAFAAGLLAMYAYKQHEMKESRKRMMLAAAAYRNRQQLTNNNNTANPDQS